MNPEYYKPVYKKIKEMLLPEILEDIEISYYRLEKYIIIYIGGKNLSDSIFGIKFNLMREGYVVGVKWALQYLKKLPEEEFFYDEESFLKRIEDIISYHRRNFT